MVTIFCCVLYFIEWLHLFHLWIQYLSRFVASSLSLSAWILVPHFCSVEETRNVFRGTAMCREGCTLWWLGLIDVLLASSSMWTCILVLYWLTTLLTKICACDGSRGEYLTLYLGLHISYLLSLEASGHGPSTHVQMDFHLSPSFPSVLHVGMVTDLSEKQLEKAGAGLPFWVPLLLSLLKVCKVWSGLPTW